MNRVVKLKMDCNSEVFRDTVRQYTSAYNEITQSGWETGVRNRTEIHKITYYEIRHKYDLPSQLVVSAISKAVDSLKTTDSLKRNGQEVTCPESRKQSIRYDARSCTLDLRKQTVSLATNQGRVAASFVVPEYFRKYLDEGWKVGSSELMIRGSEVFLHVSVEHKDPSIEPNGKRVGIDRGINRVAVTSTNQFFGDSKIWTVVEKYQKLKGALRSYGSRSAQRHLAKLSRKEKRFRADVDHFISKKIIDSLEPGTTIILEDLSGIRDRCNFRKPQGKKVHRWSFFRLAGFLTYKGDPKGIRIEYRKPHYTSQACSKCGHCEKANRQGSRFSCKKCGFRLNADLNSARNIESMLDATCHPARASVNKPIAPRKSRASR